MAFLDDTWHGGIERIYGFPGLEEYIRILGRAAQDRMFRVTWRERDGHG